MNNNNCRNQSSIRYTDASNPASHQKPSCPKGKGTPIAVFDFDGTIISGNIGFEFNKWLIMQSLLRSIAAIICLPLIFLLVLHPATIKFGMNIGCYIATAFQRRSLLCLRKQFINYYFNQMHTPVYESAIHNILLHQANGEKVVIISGSQNWLVWAAIKQMGLTDITLIASKQRQFLGGKILSEHCIAENKLVMAKAAGIDPTHWQYGYTDSCQDIPMMQPCQQVFVINPSMATYRGFNNAMGSAFSTLNWHACAFSKPYNHAALNRHASTTRQSTSSFDSHYQHI